MMDETRKMAHEVRLITAILMLILAGGAWVIFPDGFRSISMGIVIGAFTGMMGFNMIVHMADRIDGDSLDVKARAFRSYTRRYLLYAVIFAMSAMVGVNIIALLAGMLAHKASILIYTWKHRKEDD